VQAKGKKKKRKKNLQTDDPFKCEYKRKRREKKEIGQ
jgi:hypothetical protein